MCPIAVDVKMLRSCGFQGGAPRSFIVILCPLDSVPPSSPHSPTQGASPLSIVYVKKMIIIYRIWDQKFHLPFPCPLLYVYVSKLQMTQTFPQAIIRHKNVQQMLCVCLGRTQCLIIGNFCLIKIAKNYPYPIQPHS